MNQLEIKKYLPEEEWNNFYQGEDGLCTMYIDAVKQEVARSSVSVERFPMDKKISELFNLVRMSG